MLILGVIAKFRGLFLSKSIVDVRQNNKRPFFNKQLSCSLTNPPCRSGN